MAKVYKSLCNEVDLLILRITQLIEKEIRYKLEIEKLMNKGFVYIAKARYIMGSTCVTKMQLPSEKSNPIQPIATVCRAELNNHWVFHVHRKDIPKASDKKNPENLNESSKGEKELNEDSDTIKLTSYSESGFKDLIENDPKSLIRSKNAFHVNDKHYQELNDELLDEYSNHSGSDESLYSLADPMRLFGVLVPNALKVAQDIFIQAVGLLGKCATIQSELRETLSKYNHLRKVKILMEIAAEDAKINILKPKVYWTLSEGSTISSLSGSKEKEKEDEKEDQVNMTKSIRSVFYDLKDLETEQSEMSIWSSEKTKSEISIKLEEKN